jgi:hypothetical protein
MNTNKIFSKINDSKRDNIELSKEEIELAGTKDIDKAISMLKKGEDTLRKAASIVDSSKDKYIAAMEKAADMADTAWDKGKSVWDSTDDIRPKAIAILNDVDKAAKEFGIDVTQVEGYNKAVDSIKTFDNAFDNISDALQELQKAIK